MGFDLPIEYKAGVLNQVADAFSSMYEDEGPLTASFMALRQPLVSFMEKLKEENHTLEKLLDLHRQLDHGDAPTGFRREGRLVIFQDRYFIRMESKLKSLLLREFHNNPISGHGGVNKMLASGGYLHPLPTPTVIWEDVSMDFITGMPLSKGFSVVLVVVDRFSKYAHFATLPTIFNAHKVAEVFVEAVVKHHGIPKTIVSDRDPIFVGKFWTQLFKLSAQLNHSTAYHPQTDGQTKVVNRVLKQYLRAMVTDRPGQ
ncbi:ty3-gypsy retrotransposon protein [Tanacetum coccineum]